MVDPAFPTVEARWLSETNDTDWKELVDLGRSGSKDSIEIGTALPDGIDPRAVHVGVVRADDHAIWHLSYFIPPPGDPPSHVVKSNKALGGPDGLASRLQQAVRGGALIELRISFDLVAADVTSRVFPSAELPPAIAEFSEGNSKLEQVGYRFMDAPLGIQELVVIYGHADELFHVQLVAKATIGLTIERSIPFATTLAAEISARFFPRKTK